jgi:adenylate cyclase
MSRRLRLASGLFLLAYVTTHLLNHALGLVSLVAMGHALRLFTAFWSLAPMQVLLYGGFAVHYVLALSALWRRRTLRLRPAEWAQLALGFAIPLLLVRHVVATRIAYDYFGADVGNYPYLLWVYFVAAPGIGVQQQLVLFIAWGHAMVGLHFWLRMRRWYQPWRGPALVIAVLLPLLAWLGIVQAGREVAVAAQIPGWSAAASTGATPPDAAAAAALDRIGDCLIAFFVVSLAGILLGRWARSLWQRRRGTIRVRYPGGRAVHVVPGTSVLEASRMAGIPHASICGGRGRCSTCRVQVRGPPGAVPPPREEEQRVLNRIRAIGSVRLACQLRPAGPVEVAPLLPPSIAPGGIALPVELAAGSEREIAVLFADLRGFTALSEGRLPYDIVFLLNRYFAAMGRAIETAGGQIDKFLGDGIMALFGVEDGPDRACRQALAAARLMSLALDELNAELHEELRAPLRIGIGIHAGPAIVGEIGYAGAAPLTAIGDTVNTASRLEGLAKDYGVELVVSDAVVARADLDRAAFAWQRAELRGKSEPLLVALMPKARALPPDVTTETNPPVATSDWRSRHLSSQTVERSWFR